ncbi:unnamed protein product [Dimorphilus gyrociliatus]|uniref:Uncharacterized protein n=1 Tax=Dimorphilus gyrociliatus TaxID=2664684 RepID=A0A7I8WEG3_9ANNE|nr:unnamed protein product [Dimorphilus gyrociliatus]
MLLFMNEYVIGNDDITLDECTSGNSKNFCCFEPGYGCYRPKLSIPGFTYRHGMLTGYDSLGVATPDLEDPEDCAKYCLALHNCMGFTMTETPHLGRYCFPKSNSFFTTAAPSAMPNMLSYDRFGFGYTTCEQGECTETALYTGNENFAGLSSKVPRK